MEEYFIHLPSVFVCCSTFCCVFIGKLLSLRLNFVFSEIKTADVVKVANCVLNRWKCVSPVLSFYIPKANNQFVS